MAVYAIAIITMRRRTHVSFMIPRFPSVWYVSGTCIGDNGSHASRDILKYCHDFKYKCVIVFVFENILSSDSVVNS